MKKKYYFVIFFLILVIFFIINISSVNAKMYKILDSEGNIIRITNNPVLSIEEKEAGCKILSAPDGIIMATQDQITNGQEIKQEISSGNEKYDFRKTNWGMSKEQVKVTEEKKPGFEDDTKVGYEVKIDIYDFLCFYTFLEDKLYKSGYAFSGEHTNKNHYITDYKNLKEILTKKYGKPKTDIVLWENDLFKNDKQEWGLAISVGHLLYRATWETPTTMIALALSGNNYRIGLNMYYESKELEEWAKRMEEKETSKNL